MIRNSNSEFWMSGSKIISLKDSCYSVRGQTGFQGFTEVLAIFHEKKIYSFDFAMISLADFRLYETSVSDPHDFYANPDPDPGKKHHADPDPGCKIRH